MSSILCKCVIIHEVLNISTDMFQLRMPLKDCGVIVLGLLTTTSCPRGLILADSVVGGVTVMRQRELSQGVVDPQCK